jgi:hypothetical protein
MEQGVEKKDVLMYTIAICRQDDESKEALR